MSQHNNTSTPEQLALLTESQVRSIASEFGTPIYVLSLDAVERQLASITNVPTKTNIKVRYAMKANPHPALLARLLEHDIHLDASSEYEAQYALDCAYPASHIILNSQQPARNLSGLLAQGVQYVATSLHQLELYGKCAPNTSVAVRINPGVGKGESMKVTTAGPTAAFGIWHEYIDQALVVANTYGLKITQMNTHIGCGTDPAEWMHVVDINLALIEKLPDVSVINLGGGFKVGRMKYEQSVDMHTVITQLDEKIQDYSNRTGRVFDHIEIEPGTYLSARSTCIISQVVDIVDTGSTGFTFLRINTGMNDILRPAMYGGQHPLVVVPQTDCPPDTYMPYIVVGHCCESSDVFTVEEGDGHKLSPRLLGKAKIGDYLVVEGAGAYVASMSAAGYNGFPRTREIVLEHDVTK